MAVVPLFEQANALNMEGKYNEALNMYDQLLTQNHDNAGLLATVGTIFMRDDARTGLAITLMEKALARGALPKEQTSQVLSNLGLCYKNSGQPKKAIEYFKRAVDQNPTASALTNYGSMFVEQGNPKEAIKLLDKATKLDPTVALAHWNLSLALLEDGQWNRAWEEYEWGSAPGGMRPDRTLGDKPLWDGTPGKTVAVYGEQGIGDEIMFASMLPDILKTNDVILDCHPRLKTIFEKAFPTVRCFGTRKDAVVPWAKVEQYDYRIAIGSLGKFYRTSRDKFPGTPYLKADPMLRGARLRVGISWTGGRLSGRVKRRTVPLSWWESILSNDCEFVSLQYTDSEPEIELV